MSNKFGAAAGGKFYRMLAGYNVFKGKILGEYDGCDLSGDFVLNGLLKNFKDGNK